MTDTDSRRNTAAGPRIAVLAGDGIGPEIIPAAVRVLEAAAQAEGLALDLPTAPIGLEGLERHDNTVPPETVETVLAADGFLMGPLTTHVYDIFDPKRRNPSAYFRKELDLYANLRPARSFRNLPSVHQDVDVVVARENTEGFYADRNLLDGNGELRPDGDMVLSVRLITRKACLRIARAGFELARARGKNKRVTAVHKANVLRRGDGLFLECCRTVAAEFPDVTMDDMHIDAAAMNLAMKPQAFDVIVTTNMFGDILSDEAAGLVGGLGLAPALNAGDRHAMAQAVHGSAPDIAGRNIANPTSEMLSAAMLCEWLGTRRSDPRLARTAQRIERAVAGALESGAALTPDLGGSASTQAFAESVLRLI